jgi:hypothetical protein
MVKELKSMGMELMVSVWPFSAENSSSIATIHSEELAVKAGSADGAPIFWGDPNCRMVTLTFALPYIEQ